MKKTQLSWLLSFHILFLFSTTNNSVSVNGQCLSDQRSYLLQLKNLKFIEMSRKRIVQWNPEEDCCSWEGVGCDASGRVITLDLEFEGITSGTDNLTSLFRLQFLQKLNLGVNYFYSPIPKAIGNLTSLATLDLSDSGFVGQIPIELSNLTNLLSLNLEAFFSPAQLKLENPTLKMLIQNLSNIEILNLNGMNLSAQGSEWSQVIATSLQKLRVLSLQNCSLLGQLSEKLFEVPTLRTLDISYNELLQDSLPQFPNLPMLSSIDLSNCNFSGRISSSLFRLAELRRIYLNNNQFSGQIDEIHSELSMSRITEVDLSSNQFNGSFPKFLFELKGLEKLSLSFNSFNDTIKLETFKNLPNLTFLDLSYNNLTVELQSYNLSLAKIADLSLASCKLKTFPEIKNIMTLWNLDLSNNEFTGEIPNWIWNLGFNYLNLSLNSFVGLQQPYNSSTVGILDLHSNQLKGEVPHLSSLFEYVDFSNNSLTGSIPNSLCNNEGPSFLDLSNNSLIGTIPSCLVSSGNLELLNLAGNNLNGSIPDTFPVDCSLVTLELGMNHLQGELPITLSNCGMLEVVNLGNNKIEDVFPCMFQNSSTLRVLILRSNNFHGELECFGYNYSWPQLQIIDIASNNFNGALSSQFFSSLKTMLALSRVDYLGYEITELGDRYYHFKVGVTMKGLEIELEKILTIFTAIDFSNNKFSGKIPKSIGDLMALYVLDLSHNEITGQIPSLIGKLRNLGSLDLSRNQLTGEIPSTIKDLTFLTFLNLSFNMLSGKIPTGFQLQTFPIDSYIRNVGLCGLPLNVTCGDASYNGSSNMPSLSNKEIDWMYVCASLGYIMGLGIFLMILMLSARWRNKLFFQIDQLMVKVFGPEWKEPIRRL